MIEQEKMDNDLFVKYMLCKWMSINMTIKNCSNTSSTVMNTSSFENRNNVGDFIYGYILPVFFLVGLIGNSISLKIFTSKVIMKRSPATYYLTSLTCSDLAVLLSFVLLEWLQKGLPYFSKTQFTVINQAGVCKAFLYISYSARFVSVWLICCFTFERYIAVNHPLKRKSLCTKKTSRNFITAVVSVALLMSIYAAVRGGVNRISQEFEPLCALRPERQSSSFTTFFNICYGFSK